MIKKELSIAEKWEINQFMNNRINGKNESSKRYGYKNKNLKRLVDISEKTKNIILFPNLHWDAGIGSRSDIFNDIVDWVGKTVTKFEEDQLVQIYIRPHPEEVFRKGSYGFGIVAAAESRGYDMSSAIIVDPGKGINPIELAKEMDLSVVNNGTIALELFYSGLPNINVGITSYSNTKIDSGFKNQNEYFEAIKNTSKQNIKKIDREYLMSFLHFYFIGSLEKWELTKQCRGDELINIPVFTSKNESVKKFLTSILYEKP
jgi:hypothetical protein